MIRRAPRPPERYTRIDNLTVEDDRLSFRALGLLVYLLSKPDHWRCDRDQLARSHADGIRSVRTGLAELRDAGYITIEQVRGEAGALAGTEAVVHDRPTERRETRHSATTERRETRQGADRAAEASTEREATTERSAKAAPGGAAPSLPGLDSQLVDDAVDEARDVEAWRLVREAYDRRDRKPIESRKTAAKTVGRLLEAGWRPDEIRTALLAAPAWTPTSIQVELTRGGRQPRNRPPVDDPRRQGESRVVDMAAEMRKAQNDGG